LKKPRPAPAKAASKNDLGPEKADAAYEKFAHLNQPLAGWEEAKLWKAYELEYIPPPEGELAQIERLSEKVRALGGGISHASRASGAKTQ
jgi:hypothetical protein